MIRGDLALIHGESPFCGEVVMIVDKVSFGETREALVNGIVLRMKAGLDGYAVVKPNGLPLRLKDGPFIQPSLIPEANLMLMVGRNVKD